MKLNISPLVTFFVSDNEGEAEGETEWRGMVVATSCLD
jgi:hypothetical protein